MKITTEKVGTRVYVTGNTYAVKSQLKSAGCHWDGHRKQWWIGATKASDISTIVSGLADSEPPKQSLADSRVYGKVEYKGRPYYVIAIGEQRHRLTVLDGSIDFWADMMKCTWTKRYEPTEYRGRVEYKTLGSIQRFVERQSNPDTARVQCFECGSWHNANEHCTDCGGC